MGEYAPPTLWWLAREWIRTIDGAEMAGIVGDQAHGRGYHRSRNALRSRGLWGDYSIQLAADKLGDGDAVSALDIKMPPAGMRLVTGRLLASAKDENDPRLNVCREFYGTLDGRNVTGWDTFYGSPSTSDDSHLWHVHVSFLRKFATSDEAMRAVLSVVCGEPYEGDDVNLNDRIEVSDYWQRLFADDPGITDGTILVSTALGSGYLQARDARRQVTELRREAMAGQAALLAAVKGEDVAAALTKALEDAAVRERAERAAEAEAERVERAEEVTRILAAVRELASGGATAAAIVDELARRLGGE